MAPEVDHRVSYSPLGAVKYIFVYTDYLQHKRLTPSHPMYCGTNYVFVFLLEIFVAQDPLTHSGMQLCSFFIIENCCGQVPLTACYTRHGYAIGLVF